MNQRQFHIYHCTGIDRFTETEHQPRMYSGFVIADTLEEAYNKSQNSEEPWNPVQPRRSTSVGDIIQDDDKFFMVMGRGFKELIAPEENDPLPICELG